MARLALNGKQMLPSPSVNFEAIDFTGIKEKLKSDCSWLNFAISQLSVQEEAGVPEER